MEKPERSAEAAEDNSNQQDQAETLDPNDSNLLRIVYQGGYSDEHAKPPRLEDEGQSGG